MAQIDSAGFEILDEAECYELLGEATLGRVAVTVAGYPAIFPVNFALVNRQVVFLTGRGSKLTAALDKNVVAFEVDHVGPEGRTAWSVQVLGQSVLVEPSSDIEAAALVSGRTLAPAPRRFLVKISPAVVSGRRLPEA